MPYQKTRKISPLPDRLPPQNIEAEQSVLGALMLDKDAIIKVADIVKPEDFYRKSHETIFRAMFELYEKQEPIDVLSLSNRLKEKEELENVGGLSYLTSLVNAVPTAAHIAHYANIIKEKKILRDLISASYDIARLGYQESDDVENLLDEVEQKIFSISQQSVQKNFFHIKPLVEKVGERTMLLSEGGGKIMRGVPTGFTSLDNKLSGLQKSDLIVLAARPSLGKTSLALDIARHVAVKEKIPVGIFSLEMSSDQLSDRFVAAHSAVDLWKIRTGMNLKKTEDRDGDSDIKRIIDAINAISEAPIFIDDTPSPDIIQMRTMARRLQSQHGLGLIIVDYLQLMRGRGRTDNRVEIVSEISRSLKGLARELSVPVLALSQLSRATEMRGDQPPRLSDLRESGSIEQDADVVLFIYRPDKAKKSEFDDDNGATPKYAEIHIAKHRNGPIGKIELTFQEHLASFKEVDKRFTEEQW